MNDGRAFESEVALIYEVLSSVDGVSIVTKNEKILGPDGVRQFDVVVRSKIAGHEILTIVECKDYTRPVNVKAIDELRGKLIDIPINKDIIVARNGFSKTAIQKASRLGISLCTVDRLRNIVENPFSALPVIIKFVSPENFNLTFSPIVAGRQIGARISANELVSGKGLMDLVKLVRTNDLIREQRLEIALTEEMVGGPLWLTGTDGHKIFIENVRMGFDMRPGMYFGFASQLPGSLVRTEVEKGVLDLFVNADDISNASSYLARFDSFSELPEHVRRDHLSVVAIPESIESVGRISLYGRRRE